MRFNVDELGQRANAKAAALLLDVVETGNGFKIDQIIRLDDVIFHQLQIFAATADDRRSFFLLLELLQQMNRFLDAF